MTKILFMGRKKVAAECLQLLLDRSDVTVVGVLTDSHLSISVTADLARKENLPLFTFDTALEAAKAGELDFDLAISMLYWRKLKEEFLSKPKMGCINFHPAPLPDYRGVGGYNLAILEGLDHWAATAHFVDAEIDTGEIINVVTFPIDRETETAKSLEHKSQSVLRELFSETVTTLLDRPQDIELTENIGGRYLSRSELEEMKRLDTLNDDIDRKIRAFWFPPYDGAFIEINGQRYTLVNRQILKEISDPSASSLFSSPVKSRGEEC